MDIDRGSRSVCLGNEVVFIDGSRELHLQGTHFTQSGQGVSNVCQLAIFARDEKNQQEETPRNFHVLDEAHGPWI